MNSSSTDFLISLVAILDSPDLLGPVPDEARSYKSAAVVSTIYLAGIFSGTKYSFDSRGSLLTGVASYTS